MPIVRTLAMFGLLAALSGGARAYDCAEKYCTTMDSCAEAHHHFAVCGEAERDADNDGIPCENVCGKTLEEYRRLRGAGAPQLMQTPSQFVDPAPEPRTNEQGMAPPSAVPAAMQCGGKRTCGQMQSCEEARFYLASCGVRSLDRDGDGVPCETLCGGR